MPEEGEQLHGEGAPAGGVDALDATASEVRPTGAGEDAQTGSAGGASPATADAVPGTPTEAAAGAGEDAANPDIADSVDAADEAPDEEAPDGPPEREEIAALRPWCHAPLGTGCMRCVAVCPTGAVTLADDGPRIDKDACTRCGLCLGVCDAFAWSRLTLEDLHARALREAEEEGMACFTCNDHVFPGLSLRSNVTVLPCLAAVPPEFWSSLLAHGVKVGVYRDPSYCEDCPTAGPRAALLFEHARANAEDWTGRAIRDVDELPERETLLASLSHIDEGDRRSLLSKFASEGVDVALGKHRRRNAGTVDAFHERQERLRARGRIASGNRPAALNARKRPWPRQTLMVKAARALPGRAELAQRYCATTDEERCCRSGACVSACAPGARSLAPDAQAPTVDPALCIACGACVAACAAGACDFAAITAADYLPSAERATEERSTNERPTSA